MARMLIILRSIPSIRERFIPHKECRIPGVIFCLDYIHVQEKSRLLVQNHICNLLQIICQIYLLMVLSIYQSYRARKSGGIIFKTTQLPIRGWEVWSHESSQKKSMVTRKTASCNLVWKNRGLTIQSLWMFTIQKTCTVYTYFRRWVIGTP